MSNFTFQINNCKIFGYGRKGDKSKAWGKLVWTDGTCPFEQKFETIYPDVINAIETNPNGDFSASGSMVMNQGYGEHKGKTFYALMVNKIGRMDA